MTPWPGFTSKGTLVLPLRREDYLADERPLVLDGTEFRPKAELHLTILNRAALAACRHREAELAADWAALDWRVVRTGRRLRLRKLKSEAGRTWTAESVIELLEVPALAAFRARVGGLPPCPPHVTLYVAGDDEGIGVPDEDSLRRYLVGGPLP